MPLEDAAQEPARPVDAQEADRAGRRRAVRATHGQVGDELGTVFAVALLVAGTVSGELLGDVSSQLVPDAGGSRCGEGPQLERRAAQREDDSGDGAVGGLLHTQLHAVDGRDLQRAQVDAGHVLLVLRQLLQVPGPGSGRRLVEVVDVGTGVTLESELVRISGCVVTAAREQSHGIS